MLMEDINNLILFSSVPVVLSDLQFIVDMPRFGHPYSRLQEAGDLLHTDPWEGLAPCTPDKRTKTKGYRGKLVLFSSTQSINVTRRSNPFHAYCYSLPIVKISYKTTP